MLPTLVRIKRGLIVSCQALEHEPLHGEEYMALMALAAKQGGAHGIRANSPKDIAEIKKHVDLPVIGLYKYRYPHHRPYITPSFREAQLVSEAGAEIIAIDATCNSHPVEPVQVLIERIHSELGRLVLADVSTIAEARNAASWGADLVAPTLRGYTAETQGVLVPEFEFFRDLVSAVDCPVIAEGNVRTPEKARKFLDIGAFAVVVGTAITRPQEITRWFAEALES